MRAGILVDQNHPLPGLGQRSGSTHQQGSPAAGFPSGNEGDYLRCLRTEQPAQSGRLIHRCTSD
jgi:hypothetical protein